MYTLMKPAGGNMGGVSIYSNNTQINKSEINRKQQNHSFKSVCVCVRVFQMSEFKQEFPMGSSGGDGNPMGPMGPNTMGNVLNGNDLDGMKSSPANGGPGTPRDDSGSGIGDYNLGSFGGPGENVSFI